MTLVDLVILILATWRISSLFVNERGPWDVFVWIRERFGIQHDDDKKPYFYPVGFFPQLLSCIWCLSVWVGIAIAVAYYLGGDLAVLACLPLALSAGAILANGLFGE